MQFKFLILITTAYFLAGCGNDEVTPIKEVVQPVKVMTIEGISNEFNRQFPGTVRAAQRVDLSFQVTGLLKYFPIKEGMHVSKGDVLGKLDSRDYKSSVDARKAEYVTAKANFKRAKELIVKKFISQADYDKLFAMMGVTLAAYEKAQKALEDTELVAPFNGVIAKRYVENFQDVQAKQPIVSLQDTSELEVIINVSETMISRRKGQGIEGLKIDARFETYPEQQFELYIKEYSTEADSKTQTFEVVMGMRDSGDFVLLPGMTAKVFLSKPSTAAESQAQLIPYHAVVSGEGNNAFVWVVKVGENSVFKKQVKMGSLKTQGNVDVTGLKLGDVVVIGGVNKMIEGKVVRPIEKVEY